MNKKWYPWLIFAGILLIILGVKYGSFSGPTGTQSLVNTGSNCTVDYAPVVTNQCNGNDLYQSRSYCSGGQVIESLEKVLTCENTCSNGACVGNTTCKNFGEIVTSRQITRQELGAAIISFVGSQ